MKRRTPFMRINAKGILFSIMTLAIITGILALILVLSSVQHDVSNPVISEIDAAATKQHMIETTLFQLDKRGYAQSDLGSILPFTSVVDANVVVFTRTSNISGDTFVDIINTLNLSKVFLEDSNYSNVFDGITTSLSLPANLSWGTDTNTLTATVYSACVSYTVDANTTTLATASSTNCNGSVGLNAARQIIIDINISNATATYNAITCTGIGCGVTAYNDTNTLPYVLVRFHSTECPSCAIPTATIGSHVHLAQPFSIRLYCTGLGCNARDINISNNSATVTIATPEDLVVTTTTLVVPSTITSIVLGEPSITTETANAQKTGE